MWAISLTKVKSGSWTGWYVLKFALAAVCRYNDKRNETN